MSTHFPAIDELRIFVQQTGFRVSGLALHAGLGVRTLERCFTEQLRTTPKAWLTDERMRSAPPLLVQGLSNKEVAAALHYTCESNFCRDFKRYYGCSPQKFPGARHSMTGGSHFDKQLSCFDKGRRLSQAEMF